VDGERMGRRRGRPKGTGRHQRADQILLDKLADRKAIDPSAKTAVIIKQLINIHTDTGGLRRLQRAFKPNEPGLIAAARERVQHGKKPNEPQPSSKMSKLR